MKTPAKTYDTKCWELADLFLGDHPHLHDDARIDELAAFIQQTIEDFIAHENANYEPRETGDAWTGGFADNH
jgi:hypothetical protein